MKSKPEITLFILVYIIPITLILGCSYNHSILKKNNSNCDLYKKIIAHNKYFKSFRASATVFLIQNDTIKETLKVILTGDRNKRFYFDILTRAGIKIVTLASNGESFFLISYYPYKYLKRNYSENILKYLLNANISINDLLLLLHGGIPIKNKTIIIATDNSVSTKSCYNYCNNNTEKNPKQLIFIKGHNISKLELLATNKDQNCIVTFIQRKKPGEINSLDKIKISNTFGDSIDIIINSRELNVDLDQSLFSPPEIKIKK